MRAGGVFLSAFLVAWFPVCSVAEDVDHSLDPPPPPPRTLAKVLLAGGGLLLVGGFAGTLISPHCATENARGECVDPRGSAPVFPLLMAAGLMLGVVGSALWHQDAPPVPGRER